MNLSLRGPVQSGSGAASDQPGQLASGPRPQGPGSSSHEPPFDAGRPGSLGIRLAIFTAWNIPVRNPSTTPATVTAGFVPSHESRPYPAAAGKANSSPIVVTREARSRPMASEDRRSGCLLKPDSRTMAGPARATRSSQPPRKTMIPRQPPRKKSILPKEPLSTGSRPFENFFTKSRPRSFPLRPVSDSVHNPRATIDRHRPNMLFPTQSNAGVGVSRNFRQGPISRFTHPGGRHASNPA